MKETRVQRSVVQAELKSNLESDQNKPGLNMPIFTVQEFKSQNTGQHNNENYIWLDLYLLEKAMHKSVLCIMYCIKLSKSYLSRLNFTYYRF